MITPGGFAKKRPYKDPQYQTIIDIIRDEEDLAFGLLFNFFNTFCQNGGLSAVMNIIRLGKAVSNGKNQVNSGQLSLESIACLVSPFSGLKAIANEKVINDLVLAGENLFFENFQGLTDKELKDLNKEDLSNALKKMRRFLKLYYNEDDVSKVIEKNEMVLSVKLLQSPYLEKQLNGLGDIKKLIDRIEMNTMGNNSYLYQIEPMQKLRWLNSDFLGKWILENRILEIILNENAHAELVKRTAPILVFLAKKNLVKAEIIELLWKSQQGKHEDIVRVVYDIIKDLVKFLNIEVN